MDPMGYIYIYMIICIRLLSYSSTILFVCLIDWLIDCLFVWLIVCLVCFWVSQSAAYCMPSVWSVWFNKSLKFVLKTVKRTKGQHPSTCCLNSKKMFRHGLFKFKNPCEEDKGSAYYHQLYAKWFPSSTQFQKFASQFWDWKHVWMSSTEDWNNEESVDWTPNPNQAKRCNMGMGQKPWHRAVNPKS